MTPHYELVESIGADGRYYVAAGMVVVLLVLAVAAWLLGRKP